MSSVNARVPPSRLAAIDSPADGEVAAYQASSGQFEWVANGSGGGGTVTSIALTESGNALTITDPNMTRFLMSLDDSVDLVIHAFKHSLQGDIFVQKAPSSTVEDLAQALKDLFNLDNPIKIIGTRHGEKLYESLISREEMAKVDDMGKYYRIPVDNRDLNYSQFYSEGEKKNIRTC